MEAFLGYLCMALIQVSGLSTTASPSLSFRSFENVVANSDTTPNMALVVLLLPEIGVAGNPKEHVLFDGQPRHSSTILQCPR